MGWLWGLTAGTLVGGGLVLLATALLRALAAIRLTRPQAAPEPRYLLMTNPLFMLVVVWLEELLFRWLLVGRLSQAVGLTAAIGASMLADFLLHLPNGLPNLLVPANSALFSLGVSLAYVRGDLALAVGLHYGWNLVQWTVLGYPVYGHSAARWVEARAVGPPWLTGGRYGLESSLAALVVLALADALLVGWM